MNSLTTIPQSFALTITPRGNPLTVLCLSSYFIVYFLKSKLILFYNRVIYYYTRIFPILLPCPVRTIVLFYLKLLIHSFLIAKMLLRNSKTPWQGFEKKWTHNAFAQEHLRQGKYSLLNLNLDHWVHFSTMITSTPPVLLSSKCDIFRTHQTYWWWGSVSRDLGSIVCSLLAITRDR